MNCRIADIFTASLSKLTGDEQKAAKTTASDPALNPTTVGIGHPEPLRPAERVRPRNRPLAVQMNRGPGPC
jgi:hypothetical protein